MLRLLQCAVRLLSCCARSTWLRRSKAMQQDSPSGAGELRTIPSASMYLVESALAGYLLRERLLKHDV